MTTLAAQLTTEARARRRWVALILGLFVAQIGLWIGAIAFVSGDRSHAVVDDYDRAAVDGDERRRLAQASAATGSPSTSTDAERAVGRPSRSGNRTAVTTS